MGPYVHRFQDIDRSKSRLVGGKGANLGELSKIEGISVPGGFCVSTDAFKRALGEAPVVSELLEQLSLLKAADRDKIGSVSGALREVIEGIALPEEIRQEIGSFLTGPGKERAYAIRSSATAEDLPTASFAGQQETYLNIIGEEAVLKHISKCWASLFSERAVTYRLQNGFDHRQVHLAVVIQEMVFPQAAGVLFTADPVTGKREVLSIDAGFGLGEALVSGLVNPDSYKVHNGAVIEKKISAKKLAIYAARNGGTELREIAPAQQRQQTLTDEQILELARIGTKVEAHFGSPQDIEWCFVDDAFYIVQSRPITTLYPLPAVDDQKNHVYVSVGHQQMMTDPMKPLGLSIWQLTSGRPMHSAGGRLFVDVAQDLASPEKRAILVGLLGRSDPLFRNAMITLLERGDFIQSTPGERAELSSGSGDKGRPSVDYQTLADYDPAVVSDLVKKSQASIAELEQSIQTKSGPALLDFILEDIQRLKQSISDPQSFGVLMTAMNAAAWVNAKMEEWLGEKNAADTLSQSVPNNVTSEMGLELLDVADALRPYPEVVEYLQQTREDDFWGGLARVNGGREAREAIAAYLARYGMRCAGEIDITRPRWSERPTTLVPMLLRNIKKVAPGESKRRFEQGRQQAERKEQELLDRLRRLPDGERKAAETKRMIGLIRGLSGYREYPKYAIVQRYFVYKQALLREAERLAQAGVIRETEDIYYLTLPELHEAVRTNDLDYRVINKRKEEYKWYERLTPPRVMTSEGEVIAGEYKRGDLPVGAIAGLPVSSGVVEGRARVILKMEDADLEEGDILVTHFTDPGWTPLFLSVRGLVTEVGGLMTHGAVIAREFGLPAVVGVENATRLIRDGQRIRVNGTDGYVEML